MKTLNGIRVVQSISVDVTAAEVGTLLAVLASIPVEAGQVIESIIVTATDCDNSTGLLLDVGHTGWTDYRAIPVVDGGTATAADPDHFLADVNAQAAVTADWNILAIDAPHVEIGGDSTVNVSVATAALSGVAGTITLLVNSYSTA